MIKSVVVFFILWLLIAFFITGFRSLSGAKKWSFVKPVAYAAAMATIALVILTMVVLVF